MSRLSDEQKSTIVLYVGVFILAVSSFLVLLFLGLWMNGFLTEEPSKATTGWTTWIGSAATVIVAAAGILKALPKFAESRRLKNAAAVLAECNKAEITADNSMAILEGRPTKPQSE